MQHGLKVSLGCTSTNANDLQKKLADLMKFCAKHNMVVEYSNQYVINTPHQMLMPGVDTQLSVLDNALSDSQNVPAAMSEETNTGAGDEVSSS